MFWESTYFSALFSEFTIAVAILAFLVAVFAFLGISFIKKIFSAYEKASQITSKAHDQAQRLLEEAEQRSLRIVLQANEKAEEIIRQAKSLQDQGEKELEKALQEFSRAESLRLRDVSEKFMEAYKKLADEAGQKSTLVLQDSLALIAREIEKGISPVGNLIQSEMANFRQAAAKSLENLEEASQKEIGSLKQEIAAYRGEALKKVDRSIFDIVLHVSQEVLGRALDLRDQENLVLHALEEAKKEGFFRK